MAKASPNQGGGNNRQGPSIGKGAKKGPITDSWSLKGGKPSKAGSNMAGHSWTRPAPASHGTRSGKSGGNPYGPKTSPRSHNPHPR